MPRIAPRIVRRFLLALGGTLLAVAVAGKCIPSASAEASPTQPVTALRAYAPTPLPPLRFTEADGQVRALGSYAGEAVVLNFWATWCAPCISEMASLGALSRAVAGRGIVVLAVSEDHGGVAAVRAFYAAHGITDLPVLLDTHMQAMQALRLDGIPTTLVIDRQGRAVAGIQGPVAWDAPDAAARISQLLRR